VREKCGRGTRQRERKEGCEGEMWEGNEAEGAERGM
jgi:hypothetical protein